MSTLFTTPHRDICHPFQSLENFEPFILRIIDSYSNNLLMNEFHHYFVAIGVSDNYKKAFLCASATGDLKTVMYLFSSFENTSHLNIEEAFRIASRNGHAFILPYLVSICAHSSVVPKISSARNNYTVCRCADNGHLEVIKYLLSLGADVKTNENYPLRTAARHGHFELVHYLVEEAKCDFRAMEYQTLVNACESGKLRIVKYLHSLAIDDNETRAMLRTSNSKPMRVASSHGYIDIVKYLVSLSVEYSTMSRLDTVFMILSFGDCLIQGARKGHMEIVQYLVSMGADVGRKENAAIVKASKYGHIAIVKYLVSMGANISTTKDVLVRNAIVYGHLDILKYLLSIGADLNSCNPEMLNMTRLHGHNHVIEYVNSQGIGFYPQSTTY